MKILHTLALYGLSICLPLMAAAQQREGIRPNLQEIIGGTFAARSAGNGLRSTADGKHYTILSRDHSAIVRYSYATGAAVDTLFNASKARDCNFDKIDDYLISDNGNHIVLLRNTRAIYRRSRSYDAFHYDVRRNLVKPLNKTERQVRIPLISPDGRMCAYVIDNDIYIKKWDYDTEVRVTNDGKINAILNGVTDWVYEEELYSIRLMEWSLDSRHLAFVRSDESEVRTFDMTIFGKGNYPHTYVYKYPKAGETNSSVTLKLYQVDNRDTKTITLPENQELYIPRLTWHGEQLYLFTLNRHQSHLKIYTINPKSLVAKLWMQDRDERYIDTDWVRQFTFTPKGALYVHEGDGFAHIYSYDNNGSLQKQLTNGKQDVSQLYGVTPQGEIIYSVAAPTPADVTLYALDRKGRRRMLSSDKGGVASAIFSRDMSYYLLNHSSATSVPRYEIRRTSDAKVVKLLEDNQALTERIKKYALPRKEYTMIKTAAGHELAAWIMKPIDFDPTRKYPVVMTQYSGPGSQEVINRYGMNWETALTYEGFIVVCVDGRGTGKRGADFKKCTYLNLGIIESDDQIAAAKALKAFPYIDGNRIGIFGWSFGGYNVLMSMMRGEGTFYAGVAVAPPTNWELYDSIYTERYMRTPKENAQGYQASNALNHVKNLKGKLLIVHGSADDNVHVQNVMQLTEALIAADKDYDMMIYTDKDHGIYGGNTRNHLYRKIINHFKSNL